MEMSRGDFEGMLFRLRQYEEGDAADLIIRLVEREAALRGEVEKLREALRPFAKFAEMVAREHPGWDHDAFYFSGLPPSFPGMFAFRIARAALDTKEG